MAFKTEVLEFGMELAHWLGMHATRESKAGASGPPGRSLGGCERGAIQVEFLVVAALAALTLALTLVSLAPGMVGSWWESRSILYGVSP